MLLTLTVLLALSQYAFGQDCFYQDPNDPTGYYDLTPLKGKTYQAISPDHWIYTIDVCANTQCGPKSSGYCQTSNDGSLAYSIGTFAGFSVDVPSQTIYISYTNGDEAQGQPRSGKLKVTCDPTVTGEPTGLSANDPQDVTGYIFTMTTSYACKTTPGAHGGGGISGGSVLLILFVTFVLLLPHTTRWFVLAVVYLIGGIAFNKFKNDYDGIQLIPHLEFWQAFPSLVKEGFQYTISKVTGH